MVVAAGSAANDGTVRVKRCRRDGRVAAAVEKVRVRLEPGQLLTVEVEELDDVGRGATK